MDTQNEKQSFPNVNQSIRLVIRLILLSILFAIPFVIVMILSDKLFHNQTEQLESISTLVAYVIPFFIVCQLGLKRIRKFDNPDFKLRFSLIDIKTSLIIVFMTLALIFVMDPISNLIPMPDFFKEIMENAFKIDIYGFLVVVIAAPIFEEVLYRGIILEGFLKNYTPWKAILWSAILFGASHLNPWQAIPGIGAGILMAWIYWRTKSILPGILIHFTNNLIGFLWIAYADKDFESFYQYFDSKALYFALFVASLFLLYLGYKMISAKAIVEFKPLTNSQEFERAQIQ